MTATATPIAPQAAPFSRKKRSSVNILPLHKSLFSASLLLQEKLKEVLN
jgi:hypothetical protein